MTWKTILRRPTFTPILKAPLRKSKNLFRYDNLTFTQDLDIDMPETQKDYNEWKKKTQGLTKEQIGVVGRAASKEGKEYRDTLFEHIFDHVIRAVQRPKQDKRNGAKELMTLLENVIEGDDTPISEQDADEIYDLIEHLKNMGKPDSDVNPANIPFTEPTELVKPKREGEKWGKRGSKTIYGHYRTKMYADVRQKVHGDNSKPAKPDSWHSDARDGSARPPFWQGLFAQSSVSEGAGTELDMGLLGILEKLEKGIDGAKLGNFTVSDERKASDPKFIKDLTQNSELVARLEAALKNSSMYRGGTGARNIMKDKLLDEVNNKPYTDKTWIDNVVGLKQLFGSDASNMPIGWKEVKEYKLKLTIATVDNVINEVIRGKQMMAPNGLPYRLPTDGKKLRRYPWYSQYTDKSKASRPVKKSWIDMLWG